MSCNFINISVSLLEAGRMKIVELEGPKLSVKGVKNLNVNGINNNSSITL